MDSTGNLLWSAVYGKSYYQQFNSATLSADSGYVAVGMSDSAGYILKINANGENPCVDSVVSSTIASPALVSLTASASSIPGTPISFAPFPNIIVNSNGQTATLCFTAPVGVPETEETAFTIAPNPFTESFHVTSARAGTVAIFSITGQLITKQEVPGGGGTINSTSHAAPGLYIVQFTSHAGTISTIKMVKQ